MTLERRASQLAMWCRAVLCAGLLTWLAAFVATGPAWAHASLLSAFPADGVTIPKAPDTLRLEFNEPVSPLAIRLVRPSGAVSRLTGVTAVDRTVTIMAPAMQDQGTYVLSWRVISADGHPVGGVVTFAVGHPSAGATAPAAQGSTAVHVAIWIAQFVLAVGLFIGVGGVVFVAWLMAKPPLPRQGRLAEILICGLIAAVVSIPLQGLDALAEPLPDVARPAVWMEGFATSWGSTVLISVVVLTAALLALRTENRTWARILAALALAGIGFALVASGHASSAPARLWTAAAVFLHGVCVAFWVGSLMPLAMTVRAGDTIALEGFSRLIPAPLAVLIASGCALAWVQFDRFDALWTTDYGRVLAAKLAVVLALLGLGALNRFVLVPRLKITGPRRLVTVFATECALAVAILGIVSLWRFTPPPRALAATEATYIHLHAEPAMAQIELAPVRDRGASLRIAVTDDDSIPVAAKEVAIAIWNLSAGIEPIRRNATLAPDGLWHIDGLRIPIGGVWRMRVEILVGDFEKVMVEDNVELPRAP
jgi:copper transport protein